ncbi:MULTISPECIES: helix-turn-helix domain-containing protein [unclassified Streptomyces]|uniref:helix-turn-helix domain-containing protein n=1 Tax=unclassified Streptomyces TaxID=2593676 RepID=UPI0022B67B2F|nr:MULTISPECIES: helix-turn-helix transcriptional regulator [unclassified Streptomyces]MCZ7416045.1 helix-turn-helix transcriptional regulator [Streptomyces sp. WMMC897]MCZ7434148.1 helix-turn-helix transcriptional regulator [Streptomyces sp. WMMC1477]
MRAALLRLRRDTGLPVAFGGLLGDAPRLRIEELTGAATGALRGLAITPGNGLGGKTMALSRPCAVTDYPAARHISHEYDAAVAAEGLRSVVAVPVVVRRGVRGLLYGALRRPAALGDRVVDAVVAAARDVEHALVVRDEAERLLGRAGRPEPQDDVAGRPGAWETVREIHGELRALAPRIDDPALRDELLAACGRLAAAGRERPAAAVSLTPRELDVLGCVAAGATNPAAARRLGLRPETVKAYLRSAARKLGAHGRLEAVVAARRSGLLP